MGNKFEFRRAEVNVMLHAHRKEPESVTRSALAEYLDEDMAFPGLHDIHRAQTVANYAIPIVGTLGKLYGPHQNEAILRERLDWITASILSRPPSDSKVCEWVQKVAGSFSDYPEILTGLNKNLFDDRYGRRVVHQDPQAVMLGFAIGLAPYCQNNVLSQIPRSKGMLYRFCAQKAITDGTSGSIPKMWYSEKYYESLSGYFNPIKKRGHEKQEQSYLLGNCKTHGMLTALSDHCGIQQDSITKMPEIYDSVLGVYKQNEPDSISELEIMGSNVFPGVKQALLFLCDYTRRYVGMGIGETHRFLFAAGSIDAIRHFGQMYPCATQTLRETAEDFANS